MDGVTNMTFEEQHEQMCDAIINQESLSIGSHRNWTTTPYFNNDLADKLHEQSGAILTAYIHGDDEAILNIMKKLCNDEIESLIDLVWG